MGTVVVLFILSLAGLALGMMIFASVRGVRAYWRARGKRLVTCPENHCAAAVELDAKGAGLRLSEEVLTSASRIVRAGRKRRIAPRIACRRSKRWGKGAWFAMWWRDGTKAKSASIATSRWITSRIGPVTCPLY